MKSSIYSGRTGGPRSEPLKVIYRRVADLEPNAGNPRTHGQKQIRQIAASIAAFDFNVPILIDRDNNIIAGHGRWLASRELGWAEGPTLRLDHLSPDQARVFMIADNRLSEIAIWDDRLLAQQLKELSLLGLNFNVEITGFEMGEIDLRIGALDEEPEPAEDPADAVTELPERRPVSKIGDQWLLEGHRVLCGNALDVEAFAALMGKKCAAAVIADPPYNVAIYGHASGLGATVIGRSRWPRAR